MYIKKLKEEYDLEDLTLVSYCDVEDNDEYIAVFDDIDQCKCFMFDQYGTIVDKYLCIRGFTSLIELELRVIKEFGRTLDFLIHRNNCEEEEAYSE